MTRNPANSGSIGIRNTARYIVVRRCPMPDGSTSVPVSLRVPAEIIEKLDKVAAFYERPRSWVMVRALRRYLSEEGQEAVDCLESIAELDRGEGIPLDEVLVELDEKIAAMEAKRAAE